MTSTITAIAIPTPAEPLPGLFRVNAMTPNTIAAMASGMAIKNSSAINSATTAKTSEPMAAFLVPFVVIASGSSGSWFEYCAIGAMGVCGSGWIGCPMG